MKLIAGYNELLCILLENTRINIFKGRKTLMRKGCRKTLMRKRCRLVGSTFTKVVGRLNIL